LSTPETKVEKIKYLIKVIIYISIILILGFPIMAIIGYLIVKGSNLL